jgi:regulator of RNase E activity RraA
MMICRLTAFALTVFTLAVTTLSLQAQVGILSADELIQYTPQWEGERFADGRPKVADDLLERMKKVSIEEAWAVLRRHEYHHQFDSGWVITGEPPVLVGRAVTAFFLPKRPDLDEATEQQGKKDGRIGGQNSWIIDTLVKDDVIVVDMMGKIIGGTFMGDNLANSIWAKTGGTGVVVDGGSRDLEGVDRIPGFVSFTRGWDPSFITDLTLMGINTPIRIGRAVVMPGDVVLGKKEGVIFIPAHLAREVVESSEIIRLRDQFGHQRLHEGTYTPGEIDRKWTDKIEQDFARWLKEREQELTPYQKEKLLKGRTW